MIELKGIAWDHPRGYEPLRKLSELYAQKHQGVIIKWDVRSLKEFGDMPIEDLIEQYDLITIDHPYMGQAHCNGLLLDLKKYIPIDLIDTFREQSVGPCFSIYHYNDFLYALPIDAAALVAAYRKDLINEHQLSIPQNWIELREFYNKLPNKYAVAWALCPTDLWCSFLTLCAQGAGRKFIKDFEVDVRAGINALEELKFHLNYLHPDSLNWNPIQILDHMGQSDEIIYAPYLFGYSNYSRLGYTEDLVHFSNSPQNPQYDISTILGGVGLAISSKCSSPKEAIDLAIYIANQENQTGAYLQNAGQPASLHAWKDVGVNKLCNDFFTNTLETIEKAFVRPQHPGWNEFQEQGANLLHDGLVKNQSPEIMMKQLNELYKTKQVK